MSRSKPRAEILALLPLIALLVASCAPALGAGPATAPVVLAETPTQAPLPTTAVSPTLAPTSRSTPAAAVAATRTPTSASPGTPITVSTLPAAAGTPGSADKVFATALRSSPPQPVAGPDYVTFFVSFNNLSGKSQALKWYIKIWSPDNSSQSFGETALQVNDIPPGTSEIASTANWRTNPISCTPFYARVYWVNSDVNFGNPVEFKKPDGSPGPLTNFQVCPATPKP